MPDLLIPFAGLPATEALRAVIGQEKIEKDSQSTDAEFAWFMQDPVENQPLVWLPAVAKKSAEKVLDKPEDPHSSGLMLGRDAESEDDGFSVASPETAQVALLENRQSQSAATTQGQDISRPTEFGPVRNDITRHKDSPPLQTTMLAQSLDERSDTTEAGRLNSHVKWASQHSKATEKTQSEQVWTGVGMVQPQRPTSAAILLDGDKPRYVPSPVVARSAVPPDPLIPNPENAAPLPVSLSKITIGTNAERPVAAVFVTTILPPVTAPAAQEIDFSAPVMLAQCGALSTPPAGGNPSQLFAQKSIVQPPSLSAQPLAGVTEAVIQPFLTSDSLAVWAEPVAQLTLAGQTAPAQPASAIAVFMPDVARQIAHQGAVLSVNNAPGEVEIALNPEELGRVRLNMIMSEGAIILNIAAERSETLQMMRRHIDQLSQEFRELGFGDVNFSFDQQHRPRSAPDYFVNDTDLGIILTETTPYPASRKPVSSASGLDLRV